MDLSPEELKEHGYKKFRELDHSRLVPFVQEGFKYYTWAGGIFKLLNFLLFTVLIGTGVLLYLKEGLSIKAAIIHFSMGIGLSILLIPIHELIHMITYKIMGAKQAKMKAHWKQLYFLATANQFVTNRKELRIIALAPFVIISASLIAGILIVRSTVPLDTEMALLLVTTLTIHGQFCAGDFAMMSFVEHRGGNVVLYDDEASARSYFFERLEKE